MFRRAMKRAMQNAMRLGAQGIKIMSAGPPERHRDRPHASGIAKAACRCIRCAPISTMASRKRDTTYGVIGIKVWVFKGEVMAHNAEPVAAPAPAPETSEASAATGPGAGAKNAATS